ncbi:MAG: SufE family protein [Bdellovibrionales bacterium]|nr:SufE family protein [Bdellovibrionales bacterium]
MSVIEQRQEEIINTFKNIENWEERYKKIIAIGKEHPAIPEKYKIEDNLVRGCQSKVWMFAEVNKQGDMTIFADSDAMIVRGLVALIVKTFSNASPNEILNAEPHFIKDIGLSDHLSQTRTNGLVAMIKQLKMFAFAYTMKK